MQGAGNAAGRPVQGARLGHVADGARPTREMHP